MWSGVAAQRIELQMTDVGHSAGFSKLLLWRLELNGPSILFVTRKDGIAHHGGRPDIANVTTHVTMTISA
jgi:hypothetical protein